MKLLSAKLLFSKLLSEKVLSLKVLDFTRVGVRVKWKRKVAVITESETKEVEKG